MWRKNTVENPGSECIGVDLNRNFAQGYGIGASKNPCSEVYKGTSHFSEKESTAIRNYITNTSNIQAACSVCALIRQCSDLPLGVPQEAATPTKKAAEKSC